MGPITQIPVELLLLIADECATYRDLAALMASCQDFYTLLQCQLYRSEFYGKKGKHDFLRFNNNKVDYPAGAAADDGNVNMLDRWFACFPEFITSDSKRSLKEAATEGSGDDDNDSSNVNNLRNSRAESDALAHRDEMLQHALGQATVAGQTNAVAYLLDCGISYYKDHQHLLCQAVRGCHSSTAMVVVRDAIKEQNTSILFHLPQVCNMAQRCCPEELVDVMLGFARMKGPDTMVPHTRDYQYPVRDLIRLAILSVTRRGSLKRLQLSLRHGWALYDAAQDKNDLLGPTVLDTAISKDKDEVVKFLLKGGHHSKLSNLASPAEWIMSMGDLFRSKNALTYLNMFISYTEFSVILRIRANFSLPQ